MKKILLTAATLLALSTAHADYRPIVNSRYFTTTVTLNAGTNVIQTPYPSGEAYAVGAAIVSTGVQLQTAINDAMRQSFADQGGTFTSGTLTGPFRVRLAPDVNSTSFSMSGATYAAAGTVSGSQYGIGYTCYLNIRLNNLQAFARFTGVTELVAGSSSVTYARDVTANCTTSISWLPVFGQIADTFAARMAASEANTKIDAYAAGVINTLVKRYGGGVNSGLDRISGVIQQVTQANGVTVNVQEVMNLLQDGRGTIDMTLGAWAPVVNKSGVVEPPSVLVGQLLNLSFSHPWIGDFQLGLTDTANIRWEYVCPPGSKTCWIP